jgi:hypothetical protein
MEECGQDSNGSGQGSMTGCFVKFAESWSFVKDGEFIRWLSDIQYPMMISVSWNELAKFPLEI